jgi:DNA repair exonuclease SbcCD ATPase subunit
MNNQRRKALAKISLRLQELQGLIDTLTEDTETERDAEQEAFDNLPESLQEGERGQAMQAAIEALDEVCNGLSEFSPSDLSSKIDEACE